MNAPMPYEPGSPECRVLIDCKVQIESMLLALGRIDNSQHIRDQLLSVHNLSPKHNGRVRRKKKGHYWWVT